MTRFLISTLTLGLLLFGRAHAQESDVPYQVEAGFEWGQQESDSDRSSIMVVGANVYFTPVAPEDQPVPERPFMQQAGYMSVFGGRLTFEDLTPLPSPDLDGTQFGVNLLVTGRDMPVGLSFNYQLATIDFEPLTGFPLDLEISFVTGELWLFVGSHSAVIAGFSRVTSEFTGDPFLSGVLSEEEEFHVRYKRVQRLEGSKWVNMEVGVTAFSDDDDNDPATDELENTEVFFLFDVWTTPYVGVGAGLRINTGDDDPLKSNLSEQGTTVEVRAALNAGSRFGLSVSIENFSVKDETLGEDETQVLFQVLARF